MPWEYYIRLLHLNLFTKQVKIHFSSTKFKIFNITLFDGFGNVDFYNMVDYYKKILIKDLKDTY